MSEEQTNPGPVRHAAWKQMLGMTVYLGACVLGYHLLNATNLSRNVLQNGPSIALALGLMFSAWRYGVLSPAIGTFVGWVLLGVIAAYTLG